MTDSWWVQESLFKWRTMRMLHFKTCMQFGGLAESNLLTSQDCQNIFEWRSVCVCCANIWMKGMHTYTKASDIPSCIRYRYFGLILSSYSDRPNKSEQCTFTFHYPWPEAFDTVSSCGRVGITYHLMWHQTWKSSTVFILLGSRSGILYS